MKKFTEGYIAIGRIGRAHGTRGWVSVDVYSGLPDRLDAVKIVFVEQGDRLAGKSVAGTQHHGKTLLLKLKDVDDREEAKRFTGTQIWLPEEQAVRLPGDTFFVHELVGLKVFDEEKNFIGRLEEVLSMGGNDVYVVRDGEREILIPAVAEFVKKVDVNSGEMLVCLWEEM